MSPSSASLMDEEIKDHCICETCGRVCVADWRAVHAGSNAHREVFDTHRLDIDEVTLKKRSFSLSGHRTSVALEEEFWAIIDTEAKRADMSLAAFVSGVDKARGERPLASALRLAALAAAKSRS
jgi:predicted DNA-binding ribbon-helix-helix protein